MKSWGIYIVVAIGFFAYNSFTKVDRDEGGAIVGQGNIGAFDIRIGDCFDDANDSAEEIGSVKGVPCEEPHDNEAYAVFDVDVKSYPEGDGMWELAYDACLKRFDTFAGTDYESSSLDIFAMYPSTSSWKQDDREVICAVYDMNAEKLVGSAQGKGI